MLAELKPKTTMPVTTDFTLWMLVVAAAAHGHSASARLQLGYCWTGVQLQDIHKLGVGITGDAHKLQRDFGVQCNGLVCLSEEASLRLTKDQMPDNRGLAGQPLTSCLPVNTP